MRIERLTQRLVAGALAAAGLATAADVAVGQCPAKTCCFEVSDAPGCSDPDCCMLVCDVDPFCCTVFWEQGCVNEAMISCTTTPPCNDLCADADELTLPVVALSYNTANALTDGPAIGAACFVGGTFMGADIWYRFTIPQDGSLFVNNCLTSGFDTVIALYTGECGALTQLACNDDGIGCAGLGSTIQIDVTMGTEIIMRLGGLDGATGAGTVDVQIASDLCPGGGGDCCISNGSPGCDDVGCCSIVCGMDPFCCQVTWDGICADEALKFCAGVCKPPVCGDVDAGSCCAVNGSAACNNQACCDTVCAIDPTCCADTWSQACVDLAVLNCGLLCDCDLVASPGATPEPEACGASSNGGCNSTPPGYGVVMCGQTIAGTAWADNNLRDTDWYRIMISEETEITAEVTSEFPSVVFMVDGLITCETLVVGLSGGGEGCQSLIPATATLPPGLYAVFVATGDANTGGGVFTGFPCAGGNNSYELTVTCAEPAGCPADVDGDGQVAVTDLTQVILTWGCTGAGACAADVNDDGVVNVADLTAVILAWGPC